MVQKGIGDDDQQPTAGELHKVGSLALDMVLSGYAKLLTPLAIKEAKKIGGPFIEAAQIVLGGGSANEELVAVAADLVSKGRVHLRAIDEGE